MVQRNTKRRILTTLILIGAALLPRGLSFVMPKKTPHHQTPSETRRVETTQGKIHESVPATTWGETNLKPRNDVKSTLSRMLQSYLRATEERPYITKGITAGVVNSLGDILAQYLEASNAQTAFYLDWIRLEVFFLCGLLYVGPFVHTWYEQLEKVGKWLEKKYDSPKHVQTIAKVVMDQTVGVVMSTPLYFFAYEIIDACVRGRLPLLSAAAAKISENLGSVLLTNYYVWPAVNWISFSFVPVQLRVLLNNVVGVLWNAFMCTIMAG